MEEELFEDTDGRQTEMTVAKGNEEVIFHLRKDLQPIVQVVLIYVCLCTGVKYLDVRPLKTLQVLFLHDLLQGLTHEEGVPFLRCAVGTIFLSVRARDVDFFLGARQRVHFQRGRSDVLGADQQNLQILLGEFRVEVHDLSEVDQADLKGGFGRLLLEDRVDDLEKDGSVMVDRLLVDGLEA